jgi:hypothetical protein
VSVPGMVAVTVPPKVKAVAVVHLDTATGGVTVA